MSVPPVHDSKQAPRRALILAAHGSGDGSRGNALVRELADQVAQELDGVHVSVAFHQGSPSFHEAATTLDAAEVTVVPVLTSDGFYRRTMLPRAFENTAARVRITPAIGAHPLIIPTLARLVTETLDRHGWPAAETAAIVIGHGTLRDQRSAGLTHDVTGGLRDERLVSEVKCAFLDEPPYIPEVPVLTRQPNIVVIPFLIGGSGHVDVDIPERLGLRPPVTGYEPHRGIGDRRYAITPALAETGALPSIVRELWNAPDEQCLILEPVT